MIFSSSHVQMWELNHKESWLSKNLRRLLRVPWTVRSNQSILKDQPWKFIGRTNAEAKVPILWPPDEKSWLIGKNPDVGKDWGQEKKGPTEDEMVGCHHWLNGHEFEQTPGYSEGQGSLACCSPWGCKETDWTRDWTTRVTLSRVEGGRKFYLYHTTGHHTPKKKKKKKKKKSLARDFPGGPVAKTLCSQCRGLRLDPWSGNYIPHATSKSSHTTTMTHSSQINTK